MARYSSAMNALSHEFDLSAATELPPLDGDAAPPVALERIAGGWQALHEAADAVAGLAQLGYEAADEARAAFPAQAVEADPGRSMMAMRGIEDLSAVMQTGLRALLGAVEEGRDATAAAVTLWREFHAGRKAIRALIEPLPTN